MKLYQLDRDDLFTVDHGELLSTAHNMVYRLDHLDGAYSVCYSTSADTNVPIHFSVGTPVKQVAELLPKKVTVQ